MSAERELNTGNKKLYPEYSEKIIECQIREIHLKEKEIELKKKETDNNYHFAKESLRYQSEDYKELRRQEIRKEKMMITVISISIFLFFSFIMAAMIMNKDKILSDMINIAGYVFGGGITGYGIGIRRNKVKIKQPE